MYAAYRELSKFSRPWQGNVWIQLLAVAIGVLPLYSSLIILELRHDEPLSVGSFILYLAVIAPLSIVIVFVVLRFLCGGTLRDLNLRAGKLLSDLLAAIILSPVIIVANVISQYFLSQLLPEYSANTDITNLFSELAGNTGLLVLFTGLLIPLGAASEEIVRVFLLSRLWKVWPSITGKLTIMVIAACLFGLTHLYQGGVSALWTVIFGLIMSLYYLRFGRALPLILAHYLTNTLQVVVFALSTR